MASLIKTLADFAKGIRNFLGIAAFVILAGVVTFLWLFSRGAFDTLIANFDRLTPEQFFQFVLSVLGMLFVIVVILIVLSFAATRKPQLRTDNFLSVFVHHEGDVTHGIEGALVTLLTSPMTQQDSTDRKGSVNFYFPSNLQGKRVKVNARKTGYSSAEPKTVTLKDGAQVFVPLSVQVDDPKG